MAADDAPVGLPEAQRRLEMLRRALQAELQELIRELDTEGGVVVSRLDRLANTERIRELDTEGGVVVSRLDRLANTERIRSQIVALLRDEGPVVLTIAEVASQQAAEDVLEKYERENPPDDHVVAGIHASFRPDATATARRVTSGAMNGVLGVFEAGQQAMRVAVDEGITFGRTQAKVLADVAQALDTTIGKAAVAVDLAVNATQQAMLIEMAEQGARATGEQIVYLYDGPDDSKKRPFCARIVGKCFTRAAMSQLRNDAGQPADVYCGSFGCRDRWVPMTLEDANEEGVEVVGA